MKYHHVMFVIKSLLSIINVFLGKETAFWSSDSISGDMFNNEVKVGSAVLSKQRI